jgi:hypothetical protein
MEVAVHLEVLLLAFTVAMVLGSVAAKTNFCTMGAVSDWINIGETSRLRSWLLAMIDRKPRKRFREVNTLGARIFLRRMIDFS